MVEPRIQYAKASDGVRIAYSVAGEGNPVVLVHGWGSQAKANWFDTGWVAALQPDRRVVSVDCRGHGRSDKPHGPGAYSYHRMAGDILGVMDDLAIDTAALFGYSMGAMIAAHMLTQPGDRARFTSVALGGCGDGWLFPGTGGEIARASADALVAEDKSKIIEPVALGYRIFAEMDPANDLRALGACMLRLGDPIDPAALGDVDIPVLVINGANDALIGDPDALAAAIPGARVVSIPDTDHLTVVPDERFKEEVLAFLKPR